ncbi:hypothetical protein K3495_g5534 [Podosphaera aphanis]|nr:hypothetical protein K3495_g5534 [Podosphaera aphanis]
MEGVLKELKLNLTTARTNQEESASNNRTLAPAYRVGDKVFLSTRNIDSARPCKKLDSKFIGECRVVEVVNPHSYRIELPLENGLIHDVSHTSLLLPSADNPLPSQVNKPPPPIAIDARGNQLWAVENIRSSKRDKKNRFQYWVQWRGCPPMNLHGNHYHTWSTPLQQLKNFIAVSRVN